MLPEASRDLYRSLQRLQLVLIAAGRRAWSGMGPDFDHSWAEVSPGLAMVTSAAQFAAARAAVDYVPTVLAETNQRDEPDGFVRPQRFAGISADGRSLPGLLAGAVTRSKAASGLGLPPSAALGFGGRWLDMALQTVVTDAARQAAQVEVVNRDHMGWVRQINPPCCPKCAVLAGKWYRSNDILPRHFRCDCLLIPAAENIAGDFTTDVRELYKGGGVRGLTQAQRDAIDDGADIVKVFNQDRDRWREQMSVLSNEARLDATRRVSPEDFMSSLVSQVEARNGLRAAGFIG